MLDKLNIEEAASMLFKNLEAMNLLCKKSPYFSYLADFL